MPGMENNRLGDYEPSAREGIHLRSCAPREVRGSHRRRLGRGEPLGGKDVYLERILLLYTEMHYNVVHEDRGLQLAPFGREKGRA